MMIEASPQNRPRPPFQKGERISGKLPGALRGAKPHVEFRRYCEERQRRSNPAFAIRRAMYCFAFARNDGAAIELAV